MMRRAGEREGRGREGEGEEEGEGEGKGEGEGEEVSNFITQTIRVLILSYYC